MDNSWRGKTQSESSTGSSRGGRWNSNNRSRGNRGTKNGRGGRYVIDDRQQQPGGSAYNHRGRRIFGIGYAQIEEICKEMDQRNILPGSAELLAAVQAESFYLRLDDLWPDVEKQANFLRVIVATASTNQADLRSLTYEFVTKVLGSKLLETIVDNCISPLTYDSDMQEKPVYAEIAHHIVKFLYRGFELLPSKMDSHLSKVQHVTACLKEVKDICLKEETKVQLERLEIALKERQKYKAAQRLTAETERREKRDFEGSAGQPPISFRELSVVPTPEDITQLVPPYLRAAKLKGKYDSEEQYLDIQFRLLREDLIRPLRDGITAYRKGGTKETDLYVYNDVELDASSMHRPTGELLSYATIKASKRMRWDKRLKYGSLVCLSSDDFQKVFLFATVIDRDDISHGRVGLKFEEVSKINTKWKYKMVESPAFFEAYRHVMTALKSIDQDEPIPFSNYFVDVETHTGAPAYSTEDRFNFKSLLKVEREDTEFFLHEIRRLKPEDFGMDESQFNALVYTLTSELAVLQGPPGTGKTYMGLQIAKLLFDNWNIWNPNKHDSRPMLIVCYTNHALDQFLEGISKFVDEGIIRVGGRCQNPNIEKFVSFSQICCLLVNYGFNLSKHRRYDNVTFRTQFYDKREETFAIQKNLEEQTKTLKALESGFASPHQLRNAIRDDEKNYYDSSCVLSSAYGSTLMVKWLTQTDRNSAVNLDDIHIIRQLIAYDIPEIKAKNVLADAHQADFYPDSEYLYYLLQSSDGQYYSDTQLSAEASIWPKIGDIDQVKRLGYAETVAVELLVRMNVNRIREEYYRNKGIKSNRQLATVIIPEQLETETDTVEEFDELTFKDDDEENRMICDSNILEEFQVQGNKIQKEANDDNWYNEELLQDFLAHITSASPMTEEESNQVEDIWDLPLQRRWKLYQYWINKCRVEVKEKIKDLEMEYGDKMKVLNEFRSLGDLDVLKSAKVVGMTTTGAAKHQSLLRSLRSKILIVEEAAEVLEAHLITSLTQACQHLILIGDHKQLRPSPAVYELAKKYNLEISLFERLINNGYPYRMLKNQHRMCTDISRVLMPHFYEDLQDDPSVFEKEDVKGVTKNLVFINHSYPEVTEKEFRSHKNEYEAEYAICLAQYVLQQTYKAEQITILCTYLDQLLDLRKKAHDKFGRDHGLVIQSVDNYQGEENDIVILSLVRSDNPENKIGFLKIPNRVCVALSRAKLGLYVICNMDFFAKNCVMWDEICKSAKNAGALVNEFTVRCQMHQNEQVIKHYKDFETKCLEGGCDVPCNGRLECGHQCMKPCHVEDMDHTKQKCLKKCERKCKSEFGHPCEKLCYMPCGDCMVKVPKVLPCKHLKVDSCFLDSMNVHCDEKCQKILSCGHQCKERCGGECTSFCKEIVERQLPNCGHTVSMKCSEKISSVKCNAKVIKKWPLCKHTVETYCSSNVTALPCPHPCKTVLPDCEHLCKGTCGKCRNGRLHIACSENCKKIFLCEHECEAKCSKICPPCSKSCETECGHTQCGKQPIKGEKQKKTRKLLYQPKGQQSGRKCGEACPPCMEKCLNQCEHRQCSNKCGDPCDVLPCIEPCMKLLPCNPNPMKKKFGDNCEEEDPSEHVQHRCIGICGEECLKICKICNPEEFAELQQIFFGTEDDENARFVQLKDCEHIFEVTGLDQWIDNSLPKAGDENGSVEIVQIKCPQCKSSIRRSKRYISILNERAIDIEQIKQKTLGLTNEEKKKEQAKFREEVKMAFLEFKQTDFGRTNEVEELERKLYDANQNVLTKNWFSTSRNILRIIETLSKYEERALENIETFDERLEYKKDHGVNIDDIKDMPNFKAKLAELKISNFWYYLQEECNNLIKVVQPVAISQPMIQQITFEVQRFGFVVDLFAYFSKAVKNHVDFTPAEIEMITVIFENLNGSKEFDDNFQKEMSQKLDNLASIHRVSNFGISQKEKIDIVKAIGSDVTRWYKCPNGHHYGIGQCGRAVVTAQCPECKSQIGGGAHQILDTNQDAQNEMLEGTGISLRPNVNRFEARW